MSELSHEAAAALGMPSPNAPARPLVRHRTRISADWIMAGLSRLGAISLITMLVLLLVVLVYSALPSIRTFGWQFLFTSQWRPNELSVPARDAAGHAILEGGRAVMKIIPPQFGALPAIYGTAVSSLLALVFAVPLSFGAALFLVRLCPRWLAAPVSFLIEFLAAIPSIAYGMWGLFVLAPLLQHYVEPGIHTGLGWIPGVHAWLFTETTAAGGHAMSRALALTGRDMFCGGLVLAIMILPIITAISRDVLRQVPRAQIEGTLALGATWWQSSKEMLHYSRSALFGAVMLGLARAAGETMAITMVIGNNNRISASIFAPAQTMSSLLANEFAEASSVLHRSALAEVALILLLMSLLFNITARWLVMGRNAGTALAH
ncbi:MAG TPA: phosphate ABC transporter permease subunit PstC [Lacipirellulaceae bacterium]|nr:phosphate ABC transporter permease subunit PstC [Lacipirellulaceae bacterium]